MGGASHKNPLGAPNTFLKGVSYAQKTCSIKWANCRDIAKPAEHLMFPFKPEVLRLTKLDSLLRCACLPKIFTSKKLIDDTPFYIKTIIVIFCRARSKGVATFMQIRRCVLKFCQIENISTRTCLFACLKFVN